MRRPHTASSLPREIARLRSNAMPNGHRPRNCSPNRSFLPRPLCLSGASQADIEGHSRIPLARVRGFNGASAGRGGRAMLTARRPNPGPGGTVTCSGTDDDGYTAPVNTPVTINVQSGASVGGSGINVSGTGDSFVNNDGSISGGPSSVVFNGVAGFSKTLNNNGTLQFRHRWQRRRHHRHQPERGRSTAAA